MTYLLFPFLFFRTSITPRAYSCHYHYRQRHRHYSPHRHRSSRAYYQLRRKKDKKRTALIAHNHLIATFHGPWQSTDLPVLQPPWEYPTAIATAANDLFGTPAAWSLELLTHKHSFVDPIKQIRSLKILSGGSFLATEPHRKHIRWKSHTRRAMGAAATFIHSHDLTDLTDQPKGDLPSSATTALTQHMTIYLSNKGDDLLPIVIYSGASISLTTNYNDFVGPIRPATITGITRTLQYNKGPRGLAKSNGQLGMCLVQREQLKPKHTMYPQPLSVCLAHKPTFVNSKRATCG